MSANELLLCGGCSDLQTYSGLCLRSAAAVLVGSAVAAPACVAGNSNKKTPIWISDRRLYFPDLYWLLRLCCAIIVLNKGFRYREYLKLNVLPIAVGRRFFMLKIKFIGKLYNTRKNNFKCYCRIDIYFFWFLYFGALCSLPLSHKWDNAQAFAWPCKNCVFALSAWNNENKQQRAKGTKRVWI